MSTKKRSTSATELACPSCGLKHEPEERFCSRCGMPLVQMGAEPIEAPVSEAHRRARKINPAYTEGELVRVASGRNQAEAELIQGLLLEEGVPSILRRSAGFDVPDFLAAGPRDVLVPHAGAPAARDVLMQAELGSPSERQPRPSALKLVVAVLLGGGTAALIAWGLLELAR